MAHALVFVLSYVTNSPHGYRRLVRAPRDVPILAIVWRALACGAFTALLSFFVVGVVIGNPDLIVWSWVPGVVAAVAVTTANLTTSPD